PPEASGSTDTVQGITGRCGRAGRPRQVSTITARRFSPRGAGPGPAALEFSGGAAAAGAAPGAPRGGAGGGRPGRVAAPAAAGVRAGRPRQVSTIPARRFSDGSDVPSLTAWQFTVAAAAAVPAAAARLASGAEASPASVPARFWLAAILVGVAGYGLSFLLFN